MTVVDIDLRTDLDRDGQVEFDRDDDKTTESKPWRFWINNDSDYMDSETKLEDDSDPSFYPGDYVNNEISCKRDLEDFSILQLRLKSFSKKDISSGKVECHLKFKGKQYGTPIGSSDFNLFYFPEGSPAYLTDEETAEKLVKDSEKLSIPNSDYYREFIIKPEMFNQDMEAVFLFEGKKAGKGAWTVKIFRDKYLILEKEFVHVEMRDIKDMYEHYTVGDFVSGADYLPNDIPLTYSRVGDFEYTGKSPEEDDYIVFVHGWRMQTWERRAFAETSYKRLFWQGYKGRFGLFSWPTEWVDVAHWYTALMDVHNYDRSEHKAWWSANGLQELLSDLDGKYPDRVRILAHSMGNVVASEALAIEARKESPVKIVHTYVATQAATVAHSYDSNAPETLTGFTPNVYAYYPPTNSEYFNNINQAAGTIINFFNFQDFALTSTYGWERNQGMKPDVHYAYDIDTGEYSHDPWGLGNKRILTFPLDSYEIFSHISQSRSRALGAQVAMDNIIDGELDLNTGSYDYGAGKADHSAQFLSNIMKRWDYWKEILGKFKIKIPTRK